MARRIAHTICRCWAMQRLRISTGSTSAEHPPAGRAAGRGAKGRVRHQQGIPGLLNRSPLLRWCLPHQLWQKCGAGSQKRALKPPHKNTASTATTANAANAANTADIGTTLTRLLFCHVAVHGLCQAVRHVRQLRHQGSHLLGTPPAGSQPGTHAGG